MNNYTPEQIYNIYRRKIMLYTKNIYVKNVKNFDKVKTTPNWVYFEKFAKRVNDNAGNLNPEIYIDALIDFFKGYFNLKLLIHLKGIKIYKTYLQTLNSETDMSIIYNTIKADMKFIVNYIKTLRIQSLDYYVMENKDIFPTMVRHYNAGSISDYTLSIIPDILYIFENYPQDIQQQFLRKFRNNYKLIRSDIILDNKIKKIADNFERIIEKMLLK